MGKGGFIMKKMKKITIIAIILIATLLFPVATYGEEDILLDYNNNNNVIILNDDDILSPNFLKSTTIITPPATPPATTTATAVTLPQATSVNSPATIVVHRISNICIVYDKLGQVVKSFVVSTGRKGHSTPLGTYRIYEHSTGNGYHLMVDGTYGKWCMRFKQGGYMFHSVCFAKSGDLAPIAQEVADLGTSVSRGCVRLSVTDAEWLYKNTANGCVVKIINQ